ncbi:hypothetical protein H7X65_00900 [Candidatus Parcubacteria bacterium]|nr:hypothetical protein [Candidatus Parcubacteria bacterium]
MMIESLISLGYSDKEARIYITLLSVGKSSIISISEKSGLKRPTVYLIIDKLVEKGLVIQVLTKGKRLYQAIDPKNMVEQVKRQARKVEDALPSFMDLMNTNSSIKSRMLYFDGIKGIKQALNYKIDQLKGSKIDAFFGTTEDATKELIQVFHQWNKDCFENNIKIRSIAPSHESLKTFRTKEEKYGFESKIVSKSLYGSKQSIDITKEFVRIIFIKEKQALIIESEGLVEALRMVFKLTWSGIK